MDGDDSFHLPSDEEFEIDGNLNVVVKESSDDEDADDPAPQGGHNPAGEVSAGMHPDLALLLFVVEHLAAVEESSYNRITVSAQLLMLY